MGLKKGPPPKAEKDRSERWLLTYSDLITLLLIFFIVLYSMSKIDSKRFEEMSKSLAIVFNGAGRSGVLEAGRSLVPGDKVYKERLEMQSAEERVRRMIAERGLEGKISTDLGQRGLVISVKDTVLFQVGSAELTPAAREVMKNVTTILSAMPNPIRIEGHSDTVPIHTEKYYSNWELSTARATNVLQFFIKDCRIAPERLSAAGYGEYRPLVPNSSDRNRARNRRVDIVLLSSAYSKFEPGSLTNESIKPAPLLSLPFGDSAAAKRTPADSSALKSGAGTTKDSSDSELKEF